MTFGQLPIDRLSLKFGNRQMVNSLMNRVQSVTQIYNSDDKTTRGISFPFVSYRADMNMEVGQMFCRWNLSEISRNLQIGCEDHVPNFICPAHFVFE
ncbi:hypothetical protein AVEN_196663-1 [Araneus ventricosus]|uniref:Uncharacterized protein n=1 Tax=Araneus ventricosus TaxID=182803 RepID=A0A4Y2E353_ARAVE|nr:hypothetical protein AVEN_196663-1 [Araneus ventricosus]